MSTLSVSDWFGLIAFLTIVGLAFWVGVVCTVVDIVRCRNEKEDH